MPHDAHPDCPSQHDPGEHPPDDLRFRDVQTAGEARAIAERQQHAEREGGKSHEQRETIELIEALEWREELENLAKAPGFELAELQQVERCRNEGQRHQRHPGYAQGHVKNEPGVAAPRCFRAPTRREPAQQREADERRRQRSRQQRNGRSAQQSLTGELQQHQTQRQHRERGPQSDRCQLRDRHDMEGGAGAGQRNVQRTR